MKTSTERAGARAPSIVVEPPGPKARAVVELDRQWSSPCCIKAYPLVIAGGDGAIVEDVDGNRYVDFMSGIAVASTGYNHPEVVAAVRRAAGEFLHICGADFYFESMPRLLEKLARLAPGAERKRVFLANSGTEAVEGAIKLARRATGRPGLVAFEGAFHGRSYGSMSLSAGKPVHKEGFGPFLPGVVHLPFDDPYRGVDGITAAERFAASPGIREIAAVFLEPIQGEGGYRVPRPEFLRAWRRICDEHGIVLVLDEVQSGVGRTGRMWACEHAGVVPDVLLAAKGLGSGLPIGAIVAKESLMTWPRGSHGSTFGGNPVSCAAALATLDLVERELCANAERMGARLIAGLRALQSRHARIGDVRGLGLMIGVELVEDPRTKEPDPGLAHDLEQLAFRKGLLLLTCGPSSIRVAPPLVIDERGVDAGLAVLEDCLRELSGRRTSRP